MAFEGTNIIKYGSNIPPLKPINGALKVSSLLSARYQQR